MSFFLLPQNHNDIVINIEMVDEVEQVKDIVSKSLQSYLKSSKAEIDKYSDDWDNFKKYTNPYEYIHSPIPPTKYSVCKYKPLSRSFYKLIEIMQLLSINTELTNKIKSFHLAEGPGGFIEAISYLRNNSEDMYYGMTLINDDVNVPGWKKSYTFLDKIDNVRLEMGVDGTGDLFNLENLLYCMKKYKNSMDIITGDGGFDFSYDFNSQEGASIKLIFAQICYAIAMQKKGGTFILKLFDIFLENTVHLIYYLSSMYEKVYIVKPNTSRAANSEKYLVCKNFKLNDSVNEIEKLLTNFQHLNSNRYISKFIKDELPLLFINKIEEINAICGQQQLENILSTLSLIENNKNDKIELIKKNNIQKCVGWCIKYKLGFNKNVQNTNIFLPTTP